VKSSQSSPRQYWFDSEEGDGKCHRNFGSNLPIDTTPYHRWYVSQTFRLHTGKDTAFIDQHNHSQLLYRYISYKLLHKASINMVK